MTNTLWDFFELLITIFEEFVIINFISRFLGHDFSTTKGQIVYISGSLVGAAVVTIANHYIVFESWLGVIYMAYWFVFSFIFLDGKLLYKLCAVLLANFIVFFSSSLVSSSISAFFKSNANIEYSHVSFIRFLTLIMVQICLVYFFGLIIKFINKEFLKLKMGEWILIISVFVISIISLTLIQLSLLNINTRESVDEHTTALLLGAEICIIMLNSICFYMTVSLSKKNKASEELMFKTQQLEYNIQYAETVRKQHDEMRSIRHDMRQHLTVIQRLYRDGNFSEAADYTKSCIQSITAPDTLIDVGDVFINAILNSKLSIAKSKGINVMCHTEQSISGINSFDLCNLLGNMLDNAIEGTCDVSDGKFIEVAIRSDEFKLNIYVSNSIAKSVLDTNSGLKTSKPDRNSHGLGIKTIWSLAKKYNGYADFHEEGLVFFCHVILYK